MSNIMEDIAQLEREIEARKGLVEQRQLALKLEQNFEFRKLFTEGWFVTEAARLVQMSTEPRVSQEIRDACLEEAKATGYARRFLSDTVQMGFRAEHELLDYQTQLDELRALADSGEEYQSDDGDDD